MKPLTHSERLALSEPGIYPREVNVGLARRGLLVYAGRDSRLEHWEVTAMGQMALRVDWAAREAGAVMA